MATAHEFKQFMLTYYLILYGIFYYDCFVTMRKEYRCIWKAKWTTVKVLFLVNRYLMVLESILILVGFSLNWSSERCEKYFIPWQAVIPVVISAAGGTLLILRTHAIWGRARWVLYTLCPLFAAQIGTSIWLATTQVVALPFPDSHGPCMTYAPSKLMDLYCALPMLFDLTTSAMCIYRGMSLKRDFGGFTSNLLRNFTRHGTYYAIGTAIANAANLAFMTVTTKHLGLPAVPSNGGMLCTVFSSILISRLALSLKSEINTSLPPTTKAFVLPLTIASFGTSPTPSRTSSATFVDTFSSSSFDKERSMTPASEMTVLKKVYDPESPAPDSATPFANMHSGEGLNRQASVRSNWPVEVQRETLQDVDL